MGRLIAGSVRQSLSGGWLGQFAAGWGAMEGGAAELGTAGQHKTERCLCGVGCCGAVRLVG
jgi:hypothetical protein